MDTKSNTYGSRTSKAADGSAPGRVAKGLVTGGLLVGVALSAFAGLAYAQDKDNQGSDAKARHGGMFARLDSDGDGAVSEAEFLNRTTHLQRKFDTDKDGTVSKQEIEAVIRARVERAMARLTAPFDANEDGTVSKEEFDALKKKRFALLDRNNDGKVERKEMRIMMRMANSWRGHDHGNSHRGHRGWRRHHGWGNDGRGGGMGGYMRHMHHDRDMAPRSDADHAPLDNSRSDENGTQ